MQYLLFTSFSVSDPKRARFESFQSYFLAFTRPVTFCWTHKSQNQTPVPLDINHFKVKPFQIHTKGYTPFNNFFLNQFMQCTLHEYSMQYSIHILVQNKQGKKSKLESKLKTYIYTLLLFLHSFVSEDKLVFFIQTAQFKSRLLSNTSVPYLSFMQLTITNQRSLTSSFLLEINKCTLRNQITTMTITS